MKLFSTIKNFFKKESVENNSVDAHGNPSGAGVIVELNNSGLTKEQSKKLYMGECPDCGSDLYKGPCGGMMMNVRCEKGHRFNITNPEIQDCAPFFAERI